MRDAPQPIVLCAEADGQIGFGHVGEMRALASAFGTLGMRSELFAVGAAAAPMDRVHWIPDQETLAGLLLKSAAGKTVWNFRRPLTPELARVFNGLTGAKIWITDIPQSIPKVDLLICPLESTSTIPASATANLLHGLSYFPLGPEYLATPASIHERANDVLLTLGGADRSMATLRLLPAIAAFKSTVVVGPGFAHREQVIEMANRLYVAIADKPPNLHELLQSHKVVVTAGGNTLLEACCCAAAPVVAWEDPHEKDLGEFVAKATGALVAGAGADLDVEALNRQIEALLADRSLLSRISNAARRLLDGRGACRIAEAILALP